MKTMERLYSRRIWSMCNILALAAPLFGGDLIVLDGFIVCIGTTGIGTYVYIITVCMHTYLLRFMTYVYTYVYGMYVAYVC